VSVWTVAPFRLRERKSKVHREGVIELGSEAGLARLVVVNLVIDLRERETIESRPPRAWPTPQLPS
jgi:hypothetical protein